MRDPRWRRCYESYSEDTEVVRKMTSLVTGLQGQPPEGHPKGYPFLAGSLPVENSDASKIEQYVMFFNQTPVIAEETIVYIDKIIKIRELTTAGVERVAGSNKEAISQESDEKLEDNGGLKLETNGTFG